jgi:hypothetical protein
MITGDILGKALVATDSHFALRIPSSLMEDVKALAGQNAVSVNQFLVQAAAEKVAALKARRPNAWDPHAKRDDLGRILAKAGSPTDVADDELPEGRPA